VRRGRAAAAPSQLASVACSRSPACSPAAMLSRLSLLRARALLERHELSLRYRLSGSASLGEIFSTLEASKLEQAIQEYGLCQYATRPTAQPPPPVPACAAAPALRVRACAVCRASSLHRGGASR
jgi:hypothetical protein